MLRSASEEMTTYNEKINKVDSFTYLDNIISKDGGWGEDVKSRISKAQELFHS